MLVLVTKIACNRVIQEVKVPEDKEEERRKTFGNNIFLAEQEEKQREKREYLGMCKYIFHVVLKISSEQIKTCLRETKGFVIFEVVKDLIDMMSLVQ